MKHPHIPSRINTQTARTRILISYLLLTLIYFHLQTVLISANNFNGYNDYIHHQLEIKIVPQNYYLEATDTITFPNQGNTQITFALNKALTLELLNPEVKIIASQDEYGTSSDTNGQNEISTTRYTVSIPTNIHQFSIRYSGVINHPFEEMEDGAKSFKTTAGIITEEGVFLAAASFWYPIFDAPNMDLVTSNIDLITYSLDVRLPETWKSFSQGQREILKINPTDSTDSTNYTNSTKWDSTTIPQDQIYLIAGPWTEYNPPAEENNKMMVFLRNPNDGLADKFLGIGAQYLDLYENLIGPYPYYQFAVVENFWETGWGMPSFTLLGPQILRLPFILHSSFPHEILHNWWGNGAFVDYDTGNWCEGLTAYMADHLTKEQRGVAQEYRLTKLQDYKDYVTKDKDFPLKDFKSRHSNATQAVGYGKSLMFFHMLRLQLGDQKFIKGLQIFYQQNKFKKASFTSLREAFQLALNDSTDDGTNDGPGNGSDNDSNNDPDNDPSSNIIHVPNLEMEFDQWVNRTGAPALKVIDSQTHPITANGSFQLTATIQQIQSGPVYTLQIPIAVHLQGQSKAWQTTVSMSSRDLNLTLDLPARPTLLEIDPEFDVFRLLDRQEIPPTLSLAFGHKKILMILPSTTDDSEIYQPWITALQKDPSTTIVVKREDQITELPSGHTVPADYTVWILGKNNRFKPSVLSSLSNNYSVYSDQQKIKIAQEEVNQKNHTFVLTNTHPNNPELAVVLFWTDNPKAIIGLSRKLHYYGKYSFLAFMGDEPSNVLKGRWPTTNSPMSSWVKQEDDTYLKENPKGQLKKRKALADLPPPFSSHHMMKTINYLADPILKGRGLGTPELNQAADYIATEFKKIGLEPGGSNNDYLQTWESNVEGFNQKITLKNVIGILPGKNKKFEGQSIIVSAHYDHLGLGEPNSNPANPDNNPTNPGTNVINQGTNATNQGKIYHGADDNASGVAVMLEVIRVMIKNWQPDRTIIFVAFTGEESNFLGSRYYVQHTSLYPTNKIFAVINLDTVGRLGDKDLLFLGAGSAREWPFIAIFTGYTTGVKIKAIANNIGSSDHKTFIDKGIPAIQIFSGVHLDYHKPTDTPEKIDRKGLIKVASVVKEVIEYLGSREKALTHLNNQPSNPNQETPPPSNNPEDKVSLGTIPDFKYTGQGVKISGTVPNSPAAKAGLLSQDILTAINEIKLNNGLKSLSLALKTFKPGDEVTVYYTREGQKHSVKVVLAGR